MATMMLLFQWPILAGPVVGAVVSIRDGDRGFLTVSIVGSTLLELSLYALPRIGRRMAAKDRDDIARLLTEALDAVEVPPN